MYESPITVLRTNMETQIEGEILKAVHSIGVHVDKEELLKALRHERDQYNNGYQEGIHDAQPKWISVKDRLPDDLEEVLILVKETEFYGQYKELSKSYFCQYIGCVDDGEWYTVWCHGHRYIKDTAKEPYADKLEVTHWMPLPEPPKGDA